MYPGGGQDRLRRPFIKVSKQIGPAKALVGVAYAPSQQALGNWSNTPESRVEVQARQPLCLGRRHMGIAHTPITLKGHVGYSKGNPALGPTEPASPRPAAIGTGCSART
jgi:hypothetical protein